jgi:alpha-L-rhamnosidase
MHGKIAVEWKKENNTIDFQIDIPPNTTASIYLPTQEPKMVGSGRYQFKINIK